jgi:hypothetical protein
MSAILVKKPKSNDIRIGDYAAMQPVSGVVRVDETGAVSGLGRGAYVRKEETDKQKH